MRYKVGDCVRVQSLERYNKYKNRHGDIHYGCETEILFTSEMSSFCGQVVTITRVRYIGCVRFYHLVEDKGVHLWVDGMFEGLVEEENEKKLSDESWRYKNIFDNSQYPQSFECPEGCVFKDENSNVINATKIVLEKKKKEYPRTYQECCKELNIAVRDLDILDNMLDTTEMVYSKNLDRLLNSFRKLLICRDAYWKIAGEEMGLGKPWKPDCNSGYFIPAIIYRSGSIQKAEVQYRNTILAFPTPEMRDAFYENFKSEIEICKELL